MDIQHIIGEILTLTIMAFALGLDAFSVSLGMGMVRLRLKQIFYIGLTIGAFHVVMPLLGMLIGRLLSARFGELATIAGGILLIGLGFHIIYSNLFGSEESKVAPSGLGLYLFAFSVSLDSFSVGLSLGIYGARTWATIVIFGLVSAFLTWSGLLLGRHAKKVLGTYGEVLGGSILIGFGLKLLFPI
ncbi:manganese efflux pump MntP family protein [Ectobacillus antri]|jgi:putative Mn2+ efflux pump MntP|uniref:Putative manganese efflux pump MntP n=1 Tax=Ectobacillus antri TaxID=2486280 RepID=A0ABT6H7K0_9BACI|nr:manganese efflux pump MntP family protein [Ectobacillus antri]MDG4657633.1 manganese efflux pump MntP family protein [Ectobacillus antri]MDG5754640.1 manganese efflux pump MntP family protein [Ectobacillus antri]